MGIWYFHTVPFFFNIEQLNLTIGNDIMFTGSRHSDLIAPCFQNSTHSEVIVQSKDLGVGSCRYIFDFLLLFLYQLLDWIFINCTHVSIYPHVSIFTALQSLSLIRSVRLSWNLKQDAFFLFIFCMRLLSRVYTTWLFSWTQDNYICLTSAILCQICVTCNWVVEDHRDSGNCLKLFTV